MAMKSRPAPAPTSPAPTAVGAFAYWSPRTMLFDAVLALSGAVVLYPWASQFPGGLIRDDGFFYSQIAYNIAAQGSSSFDLVNHTDGYHQLWALLLAGVSALLLPFADAKPVHLVAFIAMNLFLILVTVRALALRRFAAIALFVLLLSCSLLMEGHLVLLLCVVAMRGLEHSSERAHPALLAALLFLPFARIDATLVAVFLIAAAVLRGRRRIATMMSAAVLAGVAMHFAYLRIVHDSLFTVSSELKVGAAPGPVEQFLLNVQHGAGSAGLPIPVGPNFAVFLILAVMSVVLWLKSPALRARPELTALCLAVLAYTAAHTMLNTLRPWYFTLAYGILGYTVLLGITTLTGNWRRVMGASITVVMVAPTVMLGYLGIQYRDEAAAVGVFLDMVEQRVPTGAPIFMVDGSGFVGWSTARPIVNGDGLVNSHAYARRLADGKLDGYLTEAGIRYFITNALPADAPALIDVGGLRVRRDEARLLAEKPGGFRYHYTQLRLWELTGRN